MSGSGPGIITSISLSTYSPVMTHTQLWTIFDGSPSDAANECDAADGMEKLSEYKGQDRRIIIPIHEVAWERIDILHPIVGSVEKSDAHLIRLKIYCELKFYIINDMQDKYKICRINIRYVGLLNISWLRF